MRSHSCELVQFSVIAGSKQVEADGDFFNAAVFMLKRQM